MHAVLVTAKRHRSRLTLHYVLKANIAKIVLPALAVPRRADELWRRTCFEAFVRAGPSGPYTEFNFSPSGEWAAYEFEDTREGMEDARLYPPKIEIWSDSAELHLVAAIDRLADTDADQPWQVAISAVIEEAPSHITYWALAHPSAKPDFHDPRSFVLKLP